MGANLAHGVIDLADGLGKIICDGLEALAEETEAKGVGKVLEASACWVSGAISWVADEILHKVVDGIQDAIDVGGDIVDGAGDVLGDLWLVDPRTGKATKVNASEDLNLVNGSKDNSGVLYCISKPPEIHCYDKNPQHYPNLAPLISTMIKK